jgi:hemerythrin superfamily protein
MSKLAGALPVSIYTTLKIEHDQVKTLFITLQKSPDALGGQEKVAEKLCRELISHAKAEQATVYKKLQEKSQDATMVKHAVEEHDEAAKLVDKFRGQAVSSEPWKNTLNTLKEMVEMHVQEEETVMFDKMKSIFSDEEADKLSKEFGEMKERLVKEMKDAYERGTEVRSQGGWRKATGSV